MNLETTRLIVKSISFDTIEKIQHLYTDPDVGHYIGIKTPEQAYAFIQKMIRHQEKHGFSSGNIYEKETGLFVGRGGLIYLEMNDEQADIEVGCVLYKPFWNKGYATELVTACLEWGFKHLPVNKLFATTHPENKAARRVLEKLRMHYVGNMSYDNEEAVKYEILKTDWAEIQANKRSLGESYD